MEQAVDPTTELDIATVEDMAAVLVSREAAPPGVVVWLGEVNPVRVVHCATFGKPKRCHLRFMAAVLLKAARRVSCDDDDCSA